MAPVPDAILSLLPRAITSASPSSNVDARLLSPMAVHDMNIQKRAASPNFDPGSGVKPATDFNNKGFQALFAILGMGMVLTGIWFFFWAKNGGFKWRQGDWEDYKSTVLRRKGPDGKTLSNATKSTKLGGGSVVHGGSYGAESIGYTDETGTSADFSEMREVEAGHGRGFGLRGGDARKHRREKQTSKDPELAEYRQEKAARVGGLNRAADGVYVDHSVTQSEVSQHSKAPLNPKPKDKKKEAKDKKKEEAAKKERAKARMREAKRKEKEDAKTKAAEAKAAKVADKKAKAEEKKEEKNAKKTAKTSQPAESVAGPSARPGHRAPPSGAYSFTNGDDATTAYTGEYTEYTADRTAPSEHNESSYYSDYRPNADPTAFNNARRSHNSTPRRDRERESRRSESHSRQGSPRKQHRSARPPRSEFGASAVTDRYGNNSYPCHIPGLSSAGSVGVSESVSQVGGPPKRQQRDVMDGYRRGGVRAVGRRDSLSDSDA